MESDLPNHFPGQLKSESIRLSGCMPDVPSWAAPLSLALLRTRVTSSPPFLRLSPAPFHAGVLLAVIMSTHNFLLRGVGRCANIGITIKGR